MSYVWQVSVQDGLIKKSWSAREEAQLVEIMRKDGTVARPLSSVSSTQGGKASSFEALHCAQPPIPLLAACPLQAMDPSWASIAAAKLGRTHASVRRKCV